MNTLIRHILSKSNLLEQDYNVLTQSSNYMYTNAVKSSNGYIYILPFSASYIVEFDPILNTINHYTDASIQGSISMNGGIEVNGIIYISNLTNNDLVEFNTTTKSFTSYPTNQITTFKNRHAVKVGDELFFAPDRTNQILKFNLITKTPSLIGVVDSSIVYSSITVNNFGKIIIAGATDHLLELNPVTNVINKIHLGTINSSTSYWYKPVLKNGFAYFVGSNKDIMKLDLSNNNVSFYQNPNNTCYSITLMNNRLIIYCLNGELQEFNELTNTFTTIKNINITGEPYAGIGTVNNSTIILVPSNLAKIKTIKIN